MNERSTNKSKQVTRLTHSEDIANNQNTKCDTENTSKQLADLVLCSQHACIYQQQRMWFKTPKIKGTAVVHSTLQ